MQSVGVRGAKLFVKNVLRRVFRVMSGGFERSGVHRESIRPLDHGRVDGSDGVQRHELHEGQHGQPERAEVPAANKLISVDSFLNLARNGFHEFLR